MATDGAVPGVRTPTWLARQGNIGELSGLFG